MKTNLDILRTWREQANAIRYRQHGTEDLAQLRWRFRLWRSLRRTAREDYEDASKSLRHVADPTARVIVAVKPSQRKGRAIPKGGPRNIRRAMALHAELVPRAAKKKRGRS